MRRSTLEDRLRVAPGIGRTGSPAATRADWTLRAVLVGMLREGQRSGPS